MLPYLRLFHHYSTMFCVERSNPLTNIRHLLPSPQFPKNNKNRTPSVNIIKVWQELLWVSKDSPFTMGLQNGVCVHPQNRNQEFGKIPDDSWNHPAGTASAWKVNFFLQQFGDKAKCEAVRGQEKSLWKKSWGKRPSLYHFTNNWDAHPFRATLF